MVYRVQIHLYRGIIYDRFNQGISNLNFTQGVEVSHFFYLALIKIPSPLLTLIRILQTVDSGDCQDEQKSSVRKMLQTFVVTEKLSLIAFILAYALFGRNRRMERRKKRTLISHLSSTAQSKQKIIRQACTFLQLTAVYLTYLTYYFLLYCPKPVAKSVVKGVLLHVLTSAPVNWKLI